MSDRGTESFDAYEGDASYEWDYDEEPRKPKVLWGRVVALIAFLVLAFMLGRATAGGGVAQGRVDALERQLAELEAENEQLQDAAQAILSEPTPEPTPTEPATTTTVEGEGESYVVKDGDTLRAIALKFYGDASLDDLIAEANDITDPTQLSVGTRLVIPPEPE